ncbi:histidine kinase [Actinoallomurus spadix]|uniref:histidine kinase n=1 Tax=Actinoallomurus spadix TaxID=79912 RepID=A0ABN0WWI9_9ACTN
MVALSFIPGVADKGTDLAWPTSQRSFGPLAALLVLGHGLPLLMRTRAPTLCLAIVSAAFFAYQCLGYRPTAATIALYIALYSVGLYQVRRRQRTVVAWTAGYAALLGGLTALGAPESPTEGVEFFALPAGCWLVGTLARTRLREQERRQRESMEAARREEREHIARELHDVVTHHVTAIVMQADAALYVPPDNRAEIEEGLTAIGGTGRRALGDLRAMLGVLSPRHDAEPAPRAPAAGLFTDLVAQTRLAGQPVELVQDGPERMMDDMVALAAYRVVQEALTNALKHAPGRKTVVHLTWSVAGRLTVDVTTDGPGGAPARGPAGPPPAAVPSGRGLAGLRRRVLLAGGELTTRQEDGGGFVLHACFPTEADAS